MQRCTCGRIARYAGTVTRGKVAVDRYECRHCGYWEDYRFVSRKETAMHCSHCGTEAQHMYVAKQDDYYQDLTYCPTCERVMQSRIFEVIYRADTDTPDDARHDAVIQRALNGKSKVYGLQVGKDIRRLRQQLGLRLKDAAALIGVPIQTVSCWEHGLINTDANANARRLLAALQALAGERQTEAG